MLKGLQLDVYKLKESIDLNLTYGTVLSSIHTEHTVNWLCMGCICEWCLSIDLCCLSNHISPHVIVMKRCMHCSTWANILLVTSYRQLNPITCTTLVTFYILSAIHPIHQYYKWASTITSIWPVVSQNSELVRLHRTTTLLLTLGSSSKLTKA